MLPQRHLRRHDLSQSHRGVIDRFRVGGAAGVFQTNAVDTHAAFEETFANVEVELGGMHLVRMERHTHQGDTNLVMHPGIDNRFAGFDEVVDIVHIVEVAVPGSAILFHQLGLEIQTLHRLCRQSDTGNRAGENLEVDIGPHRLAHPLHVLERVLAQIHQRRLVTRATAEFEMANAQLGGAFHGR